MRDDGAGFLRLDGGDVTLVGAGSGATLDAQQRGRLFYVTAGNLTLTNLRLVNGLATACLTTLVHPQHPFRFTSPPCSPILAFSLVNVPPLPHLKSSPLQQF